MARDLDLSLVRSFVAVAEHGSMTAAANRLRLTQGAVSQQMRRLETLLGCALLLRGPRHLELTTSGRQLLVRGKQLLRVHDDLLDEMQARALQGNLRVGVPYDLAGTLLVPALRAFGNAHPAIDMSLVCATSPALEDAVREGQVDIALVEDVAELHGKDVLRIEPLVWVAARGVDVYRRRPLPLSMVDESCAFRPHAFEALAKHGIAWRTVFESGNIEATAATVRSGLAVTMWLSSTVPADLEILSGSVGLPPLPAFAVHLRLPETPCKAALAFAALAREALRS